MTTDPGQAERPDRGPGFELPDVVSISIRRIRYERPVRRNVRSALPTTDNAVEVMVETSAPIPVRALGPVLWVGETPLTEATADDETHYRFLGLEPHRLTLDAPLRLGWSGQPSTDSRATRFTFNEPE
jgi:hypothetical protein